MLLCRSEVLVPRRLGDQAAGFDVVVVARLREPRVDSSTVFRCVIHPPTRLGKKPSKARVARLGWGAHNLRFFFSRREGVVPLACTRARVTISVGAPALPFPSMLAHL